MNTSNFPGPDYHEGDMMADLIDQDSWLIEQAEGCTPERARELATTYWQSRSVRFVRDSWWLEIGRHIDPEAYNAL